MAACAVSKRMDYVHLSVTHIRHRESEWKSQPMGFLTNRQSAVTAYGLRDGYRKISSKR